MAHTSKNSISEPLCHLQHRICRSGCSVIFLLSIPHACCTGFLLLVFGMPAAHSGTVTLVQTNIQEMCRPNGQVEGTTQKGGAAALAGTGSLGNSWEAGQYRAVPQATCWSPIITKCNRSPARSEYNICIHKYLPMAAWPAWGLPQWLHISYLPQKKECHSEMLAAMVVVEVSQCYHLSGSLLCERAGPVDASCRPVRLPG